MQRRLGNAGLRVEMDDRSETIGYRIREAESLKVPFMLVIGDREVEGGLVAVRRHGEGDLGSRPLEEAIEMIRDACRYPELPAIGGIGS